MSEWFATLAPFKTKVREQKWVFNGFFILDSFHLKTGKIQDKKRENKLFNFKISAGQFRNFKNAGICT